MSVLFWVLAAAVPAAEAESLRLLDDRGQAIEGALEVCFQVDLRTQCSAAGPGGLVLLPARFQGVRAEGPDHGPVSVRREELEADASGQPVLRVPRKALLRIDGLPSAPLTVTLYGGRAPSLDQSVMSARGVGAEGVKVPAGEHVVSLTAGRGAPDLHLLSVEPGGAARLTYKPREGWSLVVRSRSRETGRPLAGTKVAAAANPGYGRPDAPTGEAVTGTGGWALFSGLPVGTVTVQALHPDFLALKAPGLTAAPGVLAFHDGVLSTGGRLRARVTLDGRPREGARCAVTDASYLPGAKPEVLGEGTTDRSGICRIGKLPAGSHLLWLALKEMDVTRSVAVAAGAETEEEIALSSYRVVGQVARGDEPVPGLTVFALELRGGGQAVSRALTGEDGRYGLTLLQPGSYRMILTRSAGGPTVTMRSVAVEDRETTVDFLLENGAIQGRVVDEDGRPVAKARVTLRWNAREIPQWSGEQGEFEFLLESEGKGELTAQKEGYRPSPSQEVVVSGDAEGDPVDLVLERETLLRGILTAAGQPVPGAWVGSVRTYLGDESVVFHEGRTDEAGRFEVAPVDGGRNRLFASGPGCPLTFLEAGAAGETLALRCAGLPAALDLTLRDSAGQPVPNREVVLRQGGIIVPPGILQRHLALQGLRAATDGSGQLVLSNLAAGDYEVFLAEEHTVGMVEAGSRTGFLAAVRLVPLAMIPVEATVVARP